MDKTGKTDMNQRPAIERVVYEHFGGALRTARALTARREREAKFAKVTPVSEQNVYYWLKNGVSPMVAKILELESGGFVTRAELRPDIFE